LIPEVAINYLVVRNKPIPAGCSFTLVYNGTVWNESK